MAYVDDPNKQQEETQVAGPAPLSSGQAPMADSQSQAAPTAGSTAPTIQSGASVNQATSKGTASSKKAPKASSGTYTNIQKYVEKNRPQAQAMAGAVSQDVGKQAESIRKSVESQKAQQEQTLQSNQQAIQGATDWAQSQISNIMNQPATSTEQAAQPYTPSQKDISRFQNLMQGEVQGLQDVQDLNVREQQSQASALQNLAQTAGTEQGRRNLLEQTFQKQGDYSRGMSGLDQLITSGDQAAREQLIQGTQGQTQNLQDQIRGALQAYNEQAGLQKQQIAGLGGEIAGMGESAVGSVDQTMEEALASELASRGKLSTGLERSVQNIEDYKQRVSDMIGEGNIQDFAKLILGTGKDLAWRGEGVFDEILSGEGTQGTTGTYRKEYDPGTGEDRRIYEGPSEVLRRIDENRFRDAMETLVGQDLAFGGEADLGPNFQDIWNPIWGSSSSSSRSSNDQYFKTKALTDALAQIKSGTSSIDATGQLEDALGLSLDDYSQGVDVDKYDVASEADVNRYNALQQLLGGADVIDESRRQTDYISQEAVQDIIDKYMVNQTPNQRKAT